MTESKEYAFSETEKETLKAMGAFYEKVLPPMSGIQKNARFLAAKYALKYIETDNISDKERAKEWLSRSKDFKASIEKFLEDVMVPQELKDKYKISEED